MSTSLSVPEKRLYGRPMLCRGDDGKTHHFVTATDIPQPDHADAVRNNSRRISVNTTIIWDGPHVEEVVLKTKVNPTSLWVALPEAERAMYEAAKEVKDRVSVAMDQMTASIHDRIDPQGELGQAVTQMINTLRLSLR